MLKESVDKALSIPSRSMGKEMRMMPFSLFSFVAVGAEEPWHHQDSNPRQTHECCATFSLPTVLCHSQNIAVRE